MARTLACRIRQGLAVHLARRRARQGLQEHERGWHHEPGQPPRQGAAQVSDPRGIRPAAREPGHQLRSVGPASPADGGLADARDLEEGRFDFQGLHAMPADLEPRILAAGEKQAPVGEHPAHVSGAEQPVARAPRDWLECGGRRGRVLPVAHGERPGDDADLAFLGRLAARVVEKDDLGVVDRIAERQAAGPVGLVPGRPVADHANFGRTESDVEAAV